MVLKSKMKVCPPGVFCIENTTIFFLFIIIFILSYFVFVKQDNRSISGAGKLYTPRHGSMSTRQYNQRGMNIGDIGLVDSVPLDFPARMQQNIMVRQTPGIATSDVRGDVLMNPYVPPVANEMVVMPINIRTQGFNSAYRQIGILTSSNNTQKILPLMGRPLISGRDMWQYYTMSELNNIKLPISRGKRSCTNEYGCDKLYDGDNVFVQGYNEVFNVTVYDNDVVRYLPVL